MPNEARMEIGRQLMALVAELEKDDGLVERFNAGECSVVIHRTGASVIDYEPFAPGDLLESRTRHRSRPHTGRASLANCYGSWSSSPSQSTLKRGSQANTGSSWSTTSSRFMRLSRSREPNHELLISQIGDNVHLDRASDAESRRSRADVSSTPTATHS